MAGFHVSADCTWDNSCWFGSILQYSFCKLQDKNRRNDHLGSFTPKPGNFNPPYCSFKPQHFLVESDLKLGKGLKNSVLFPYIKSFIDQACSVKMDGYWHCSFFACLWIPTLSRP